MDPRFVTKTMHAYLDYPVAAILMTAPFLLQLGDSHPLARGLAAVTGVAALALTVFTDHKLGVFRVLPYRVHLLVDAIVGGSFLAAPSVFGFTGLDAAFYWASGAAVALVIGLHKPEPASAAVENRARGPVEPLAS